MYRFYAADADLSAKTIQISDPAEFHHITRVLHLKISDQVSLFNEKGEEAVAIILEITPKSIVLTPGPMVIRKTVRPFSLVLACAIPKKAKFEWIIEKCTELGVDEIIPLQTKRTEVRLAGEKANKKILRYQTVAKNAAKQSKRQRIPHIHPIADFDNVLKTIDQTTLAYIPCLSGERKKLVDVLKFDAAKTKIIFFIGPEGDFTPQEIAAAIKAGCLPVSLGENVLKVDTAALSVMAIAGLWLSESSSLKS